MCYLSITPGHLFIDTRFSVGRALAISGAVVGGAGLLTNNRELQKVGGSALAGGVGLKTISKLFGK